jgi:hypothetical protein
MPPNQYALTEPGVRAILARLEDPAQLNVEIASIAAGVGPVDEAASLVPIPPANIQDFVPPPSYLVDFPALGIQDMGTRLEDDTGASATGRHVFGVVIFCSHPDQHILAWMLRRYAQAVTRVLLAQRSFPETAAPLQAGWGVGLENIAWGPTLGSTADPKTWMSWCVVAIWTRREEI